MRRFLPLGALIYTLILFGLITLQGELLAFAIPLVIYLGAGLIFAPRQVVLGLKRSIHEERTTPGKVEQMELILENQGPGVEEILFSDPLLPGIKISEGENSVLTSLAPGQTVRLHYQLCGSRGLYRFDAVQVAVCDYLGLNFQVFEPEAPAELFVVPETTPVRKVAIRPRQTRVFSGTIPANQGGSGVDFFNVREYLPGDSLRHVNWRISARQSEALFTNEFEQERVADVGIILDARSNSDLITPQGSLFEHSVNAVASVSETLLNNGNRVALLVYGVFLDWTYPGYGKIQRERIFQALTRARPGDSQAFENMKHLPTSIFPSHSQIILVSPLQAEDYEVLLHLRVRGYQVLVISPDPVGFEASSLPDNRAWKQANRLAEIERAILFNQLRQAGVHVLNWDTKLPFEQALGYALSRPSPLVHIRS